MVNTTQTYPPWFKLPAWDVLCSCEWNVVRCGRRIQMTMRPMPIIKISALRETVSTDLHGVGTAWMKPATGRRAHKAWRLPTLWHRLARFILAGLRDLRDALGIWRGRAQQTGIGVHRTANHLIRRSTLDHLAGIHHL